MTTPTGGIDPAAMLSTARTSRTSGTAGSRGADQPGGELGKDAFMSLLVASMKYQDPSKPMDGQQYMAQLAQFAQVEKLQAIEASQTELSSWQRTIAAQGMLGRSVTGTSDVGGSVTGTVTGVTLGGAGPRLTLSDGTAMAVDKVTEVRTPPVPGASSTGA